MEERRKLERVQTHLPAQWEGTSGNHKGIIINGSPRGCFVQAQGEDPGDEPIKLKIQLPDERWIYLWGQVAYHLPTVGFGLHFARSSDEEGQVTLNVWFNYLDSLK